jgi:hypothetical protein
VQTASSLLNNIIFAGFRRSATSQRLDEPRGVPARLKRPRN